MAPKIKNPTFPATYTEFLTNYEQYKPAGTKPWHAGATSFDAIIANNDKISNSPAANSQIGIPGSPQISASGAATGPGAVPPTVADTKTPYEIWMEQYGQQAQLMPTQSYTDWLMAGGMAGAAQKAYNEAVRAAETDYEKSKAMYGANAEALGRAGLTGSGYGDYLTGAGFSGMQGAKVAAADTKALTEAKQRSDYASYLMGVQQTNAQLQSQADAANRQSYAQYLTLGGEAKGVIDSMMQSGQDDAAIKAYIQQHYGNQFDSQLDGWITGAHSYNDPIIAENIVAKTEAETESAEAEALKKKQEAMTNYETLIDKGLDAAVAKDSLKLNGFTDEEINDAVGYYNSMIFKQIQSEVSQATDLSSLHTKEYINDLVSAGKISESQGEQLRLEAQEKRGKILHMLYDNLADSENATADAEALYKTIDDLYKSNEISLSLYQELYSLKAQAYINNAPNKKEPVTFLLDRVSETNSSNVSNAASEAFKNTMAENIDIVDVHVSIPYANLQIGIGGATSTREAWNSSSRAGFDKIKEAQSKTERCVMRAEPVQNSLVANAIGLGKDGAIKSYLGDLYAYDGGKWWKLSINETARADVGGEQNAKVLYSILVKKYNNAQTLNTPTPSTFVYDKNGKLIVPPGNIK